MRCMKLSRAIGSAQRRKFLVKSLGRAPGLVLCRRPAPGARWAEVGLGGLGPPSILVYLKCLGRGTCRLHVLRGAFMF